MKEAKNKSKGKKKEKEATGKKKFGRKKKN